MNLLVLALCLSCLFCIQAFTAARPASAFQRVASLRAVDAATHHSPCLTRGGRMSGVGRALRHSLPLALAAFGTCRL